MAKKKKTDALKELVELEQPKVNCEDQNVPTCTESKPSMFEAQEVSACTELESCPTADEWVIEKNGDAVNKVMSAFVK